MSREPSEGLGCGAREGPLSRLRRLGAWILGLDLEALERSRASEARLVNLLTLADQLLEARDKRIAWLEARVSELEAGRGFYGQ
jgi:hypothetical protein